MTTTEETSAWQAAGGPWLEGMLAERPIPRVGEGGLDPEHWTGAQLSRCVRGTLHQAGWWPNSKEWQPRGTDDATKGAMLGEVRRVWDAPRTCLTPLSQGRWACIVPSPLRPVPRHVGTTEEEALAAAYAARPVTT